MTPFVKRSTTAPEGFFDCEAAGLRWLAAADGGVPCARVLAVNATSLTLERLTTVSPTREAAAQFGSRLAAAHDAGAAAFGAPPHGYRGHGFFGPLSQPLPMTFAAHERWGRFYAVERLTPMLRRAANHLDGSTSHLIEQVIGRCLAGDFDDGDQPARLHGDLWSGNVMWTPSGVVLIDPAAHGGHRETDLAMLQLFGCPHLSTVIDAYRDRHPLRDGWQQRSGLHQLYPLLAHVVLFGGYQDQTASAARKALAL